MSDIEDFKAQALEGSVFSDYGTMLIFRFIGAGIIAILLAVFVVYPIYVFIWKQVQLRSPSTGKNPFLKIHKNDMRDRREYQQYLSWAKRNGYKPLFHEGQFKK